MSFEIGKTFRFESAHCLKHHDGKCARPHGHSYEFELIVAAPDVRLEGPKAGMVDDYSLITEVGAAIEARLDHRDLNEVLDSDTTTAEELTRIIWEMAQRQLPNIVEVRVKETAKTFAAYRPERLAIKRAISVGESILAEVRERLYADVDTSDANACWPFAGGRDADGYGLCSSMFARTRKAHRLAAWLVGDEIEGLVVLHTCDNPPCINPAHLYVGTHEDNEADKDAKGRRPIGQESGAAKLTEADVKAIVARVESGIERRAVAAAFSVSTSLINAIMVGRVWRHVTGKLRP